MSERFKRLKENIEGLQFDGYKLDEKQVSYACNKITRFIKKTDCYSVVVDTVSRDDLDGYWSEYIFKVSEKYTIHAYILID